MTDKVKHHMANGLRGFAKLINSSNKKSSSTAKLSRSHVIEVSESGLVSLLGGKWTSFRHMGQECVEKILEENPDTIKPKYDSVQTKNFNLIGSYSKCEALTGVKPSNETLFKQYRDHFIMNKDLPADVADHLIHAYGTTSLRVVAMGEENAKNSSKGARGVGLTNERIHPDYPFLRSEIAYAIKEELVEKPNDVICRRIPLAFLDKQTARDILPEVIQVMAQEKKWSQKRIEEETEEALKGLQYLK